MRRQAECLFSFIFFVGQLVVKEVSRSPFLFALFLEVILRAVWCFVTVRFVPAKLPHSNW